MDKNCICDLYQAKYCVATYIVMIVVSHLNSHKPPMSQSMIVQLQIYQRTTPKL